MECLQPYFSCIFRAENVSFLISASEQWLNGAEWTNLNSLKNTMQHIISSVCYVVLIAGRMNILMNLLRDLLKCITTTSALPGLYRGKENLTRKNLCMNMISSALPGLLFERKITISSLHKLLSKLWSLFPI